jgi:hypothetical protein
MMVWVLGVGFDCSAFASFYVLAEGALSWQSRNDQRIPGDTGSLFALTQLGSGPFPVYRLYAGYRWGDHHDLRLLFAPLRVDLSGQFKDSISFMGANFIASQDLSARYQFNSYRLTYAYHFDPIGDWDLAFGFTAKIRDAEVMLSQGGLVRSKANVGFVPLLHFRAERPIAALWRFRLDLDGLAAPQGRAFDLALFVERQLQSTDLSVFGGYRTLEGGAANQEVYSFAWLHYLTLGLKVQL